MANSTAMMPAGRMINWSALASIGVVGSSMGLTWPASVPWRVSVRRRGAGVRDAAGGPRRYAPRAGTLQAGGECNKAFLGGSNSPAERGYAPGSDAFSGPPGGGGQRPLYCRTCESTTRARVSLRDRRDARLDAHHLRRDPELRGTAVQGPATVDGADPGA